MGQFDEELLLKLKKAIITELDAWKNEDKVERLWQSDASLWTNNDEAKWTGWLNIIDAELQEVPAISALANEIKTAGFKHIVVLGMGGSSLCPALMANIFGQIPGYPRLHILDSTDPQQIRHLEEAIDLQKTFFIVSSKSGTTLEPNIFKEYFYARLQAVLKKSDVGDRFIAITDPGTPLATMAKKENFKAIFYGIPSIGGRYSALSNFGMVPAALMGVDIKKFLENANHMRETCLPGELPQYNPGVLLGVILGVCAKQNRNKVTLVTSPGFESLGDWLEQLLAESTGKNGKGLIPVAREPLGRPEIYENDRVFVYIHAGRPMDDLDGKMGHLEYFDKFIVPVELIPHPGLINEEYLGSEFFRWEIAVAVASNIIGINPFDQPDVEASKVRALQLTTEYEKTKTIPQPKLIFSAQGIKLFTDETNAQAITQQMTAAPSLEEYLRAHFSRIKPGDYVDFSAFIEMSDEHFALLQKSRTLIRNTKKVATCLGFGPRFLHSTGQAYKGGSNTGVFLQITADHPVDIQVPNHHYTFGLVIDAQAQADFEVLAQRQRRVLRIHLGSDVRAGLQQLHEILERAFPKKDESWSSEIM